MSKLRGNDSYVEVVWPVGLLLFFFSSTLSLCCCADTWLLSDRRSRQEMNTESENQSMFRVFNRSGLGGPAGSGASCKLCSEDSNSFERLTGLTWSKGPGDWRGAHVPSTKLLNVKLFVRPSVTIGKVCFVVWIKMKVSETINLFYSRFLWLSPSQSSTTKHHRTVWAAWKKKCSTNLWTFWDNRGLNLQTILENPAVRNDACPISYMQLKFLRTSLRKG